MFREIDRTKGMEINRETDFESGVVLNIDKPYGYTSTDVVRRVKGMLRRLGYRKIKVGHAGTLDPLATGVLLVCVGKATKRVDEIQAQKKEYITTIELGATTPSYDLEHDIDQRYPYEHITEEMIKDVLQSLRGEQEQMPPLYSAKRIDGKRAYEIAREGKEVQMRSATVTIEEIEMLEYSKPFLKIRVVCSKGTYIRSLARDIGTELDSGGHLTELIRSKSGDYRVEDAISPDELQKMLTIDEDAKKSS